MTVSDDEKALAEIDEGFQMLGREVSLEMARRHSIDAKENWKTNDPESFKKDMEEMCRKIFGDQWRAEYDLMLKEEFPEEN